MSTASLPARESTADRLRSAMAQVPGAVAVEHRGRSVVLRFETVADALACVAAVERPAHDARTGICR
jgi:hypothetical protein